MNSSSGRGEGCRIYRSRRGFTLPIEVMLYIFYIVTGSDEIDLQFLEQTVEEAVREGLNVPSRRDIRLVLPWLELSGIVKFDGKRLKLSDLECLKSFYNAITDPLVELLDPATTNNVRRFIQLVERRVKALKGKT